MIVRWNDGRATFPRHWAHLIKGSFSFVTTIAGLIPGRPEGGFIIQWNRGAATFPRHALHIFKGNFHDLEIIGKEGVPFVPTAGIYPVNLRRRRRQQNRGTRR